MANSASRVPADAAILAELASETYGHLAKR